MTYRVIFMGTPEFAVPSLKAILAHPELQVVGVMTQPDRPSGRGQKLTPSPVKVVAESVSLPIRQPERLRKEPDMIAWMRDLQPDFLVTAAFGQILSQEVLDIPVLGTVNVHASLLPKYRGANPIQWMILNNEPTAGVTTMLTDIGVDTGAMLMKAQTPIDPNENAVSLMMRMAELGAQILPQSLLEFAAGTLPPELQQEAEATHAPKLSKEDAVIDWSASSLTIHNKIRGQQPSPGAVTTFKDEPIKLHASISPEVHAGQAQGWQVSGRPGDITRLDKSGIWVRTGDGALLVTILQPPGKPKLAAKDWANGALSGELGAFV